MPQRYRRPGVYTLEVANPNLLALTGPNRLAAFVGTGDTTVLVSDVAITKGASGATDAIPSEGQTVLSIERVGDYPTTSTYNDFADRPTGFDFTQVNNGLSWASAVNQPTTGAIYYVSYRIAKDAISGYAATIYTSLADVRTALGSEVTNGVLTSPLTAAAKLAFDNGATSILIVQATTGSNADLQTAIDKLNQEDVDLVIVPQATNTTLQNYLKLHVTNQSSPSQRHERVTFLSGTALTNSVAEMTGMAASFASKRVTMLAPSAIITTFTDSANTQDLDMLLPSTYAAAAYAGNCTNPDFDVAEPRTRKALAGITNLSTFNYTATQKDLLGGGNVTVLETVSGVITIRHAVTTDNTNVNTLTQSVVFQIDDFNKNLRLLLDKTYIGTKITSQTPSAIATTIEKFGTQRKAEQLIANIRGIAVVQDTTDPRTMKVTYSLAPIYPDEYIDISFTLTTT